MLCGICFGRRASRQGRCDACRTYRSRHGHDRDRPVVPQRTAEPDLVGDPEETLTLGEWIRANHYNPSTRRYAEDRSE